MDIRQLFLLLCASATFCCGPAFGVQGDFLARDETAPAQSLRVSNNHPFGIREVVRFHLPPELVAGDGDLLAVSHSVTGGTVEAHYLPIQLEPAPEGSSVEAWIDVQLRADESRLYTFQEVGSGSGSRPRPAVAETFDSRLPRKVEWPSGTEVELFDIVLLEILDDLDTFPDHRADRIRGALENSLRLKFELQEETHGAVKSTFLYRAAIGAENDYEVDVRYDLLTWGATDVQVTLRTTDLRAERGYLAVAKQIPSPPAEEGAIRWKGEILDVERGAASPARTNRMHSWGRDANWLAVGDPEAGGARAVLAAFSPNLTREHRDRYAAANDYLVNEFLVGDEDSWTLLAEIGRENEMHSYVPNAFVIPAPEEPVRLDYRVLPAGDRSLKEVDEAFISYAGYQARHLENEELHVTFGTPGVSFGTSYFPHRTFGENFQYWRSAGLEGDRWWPLFGANWQYFKEEIRRDMRIANALGLDWIRIHHFDSPNFRKDYLTSNEGEWMVDYLGFMAETARETGLGLFLDFSLSPADARLVAERFGDVIGFYEMQNEVLLQGVYLDRVDYWREVRDEIRSVQPNAPVFLTGGPQFYSLYDRLERLDLEVDAVGQHAYVDALQSPAYVKDIALSLGSYATRHGKLPLNSKYNWRMITRESEEAQAQHFFEIYDNLLSQRSIPLLLQFQFIETLAVPPRARGALRHYEPLRLDRTPKRQAHAFHEIIRRYGHEDHRIRTLDVRLPVVSVRPGGTRTVPVTFTNSGPRPLEIQSAPRLPDGLSTTGGEETFTLRPRESKTIKRTLRAAEDLSPGVYHLFEEAQYDDTIRMGWSYASHRSPPPLDLQTELLEGVRYAGGVEMLSAINLADLRHVVFGSEAPALEVDWALYLYNTLRSATGADIHRWASDDIDDEQKQESLLLVGNPYTNPLIADIADQLPIDPMELDEEQGVVMVAESPDDSGRFLLVVSGSDERGVEKAASDLLFRYWRYAKDAASFREGMSPVETASLQPAPSAQADDPARAVILEAPERARSGTSLRLRALHATEPPAPAAGVALHATRNGKARHLGTTDDGGELQAVFPEPGTYRIHAASSDADLLLEVE